MAKFNSDGLGGWHCGLATQAQGIPQSTPSSSFRCRMWWTGHWIGIFSLTDTRRVTSETKMVDLVLARQFATAHVERAAEPRENGG